MVNLFSPMMTLSFAIVLEVVATTCLPRTNQFSSPMATVLVLASYGLAFYFLSLTVKGIPLGIAYAIWCGAGIVLVALLGWLVYGQKIDIYATVGIALILTGTLIINLFSSSTIHH